jgi:hypothetical protein
MLGIVGLLPIVMRGWRNLLLVLVNLPFALVGGVMAIFATGDLERRESVGSTSRLQWGGRGRRNWYCSSAQAVEGYVPLHHWESTLLHMKCILVP